MREKVLCKDLNFIKLEIVKTHNPNEKKTYINQLFLYDRVPDSSPHNQNPNHSSYDLKTTTTAYSAAQGQQDYLTQFNSHILRSADFSN